MGYLWLVLRTAFRHSLDITQTILFIGLLILGALAWLVPSIKGLPDMSGWQAAAVVLALIVGVRLLLAPYWIWKEDQKRLSGVGIAFGLHIPGFSPALDLGNASNAMELRPQLQNGTDSPLSYQITELVFMAGGHKATSSGASLVIPARGTATFFANSGIPKKTYLALPTRSSGGLTLKIQYGIAGAAFSRMSERTYRIDIFKKSMGKKLHVNWTILAEKEWAI